MQGRTRCISTKIIRAIVNGENAEKEQKARSDGFLALRCDVCHLSTGAYTLQPKDESPSPGFHEHHAAKLVPMVNLGDSGSTFFDSLHRFFMHVLLTPYLNHMREQPDSLLVRITDLLQDDIAHDNLASQSVKNKPVDHFPSKVHIPHQATEEPRTLLDTGTKFLADFNVLDYSLFLMRFPRTAEPTYAGPSLAETKLAARPIDSWRTGVVSSPMTITTEPLGYRKRFMRMVKK
ncbi:hypothetical protein V8C34DRAFT_322654 [Trichoderma compactum]